MTLKADTEGTVAAICGTVVVTVVVMRNDDLWTIVAVGHGVDLVTLSHAATMIDDRLRRFEMDIAVSPYLIPLGSVRYSAPLLI